MQSTTRAQRSYAHCLRDLVRSTADIGHATRRGVPRSTARGWLKSQRTDVVTLDIVDKDLLELHREVLALRSRIDRLLAVLRLLIVLLKVSGFTLATARVPDGHGKALLLRTIERARAVLDPCVTAELLVSASKDLVGEPPTLLADGASRTSIVPWTNWLTPESSGDFSP